MEFSLQLECVQQRAPFFPPLDHKTIILVWNLMVCGRNMPVIPSYDNTRIPWLSSAEPEGFLCIQRPKKKRFWDDRKIKVYL